MNLISCAVVPPFIGENGWNEDCLCGWYARVIRAGLTVVVAGDGGGPACAAEPRRLRGVGGVGGAAAGDSSVRDHPTLVPTLVERQLVASTLDVRHEGVNVPREKRKLTGNGKNKTVL